MLQLSSFDNCIHRYNIEVLNLLNPKPMVKSELKEWLSELKKFKVHSILILEYKKKNDHKTFHSSVKLAGSDQDIDEAF